MKVGKIKVKCDNCGKTIVCSIRDSGKVGMCSFCEEYIHVESSLGWYGEKFETYDVEFIYFRSVFSNDKNNKLVRLVEDKLGYHLGENPKENVMFLTEDKFPVDFKLIYEETQSDWELKKEVHRIVSDAVTGQGR
jgi:hypothetical protein